MNVVLESKFSKQSLRDYIEKIEICDIILEDINEELFDEFMTFIDSFKKEEISAELESEQEKKEIEEEIPLYFQILTNIFKFHSNFAKKALFSYPNFMKKSTIIYLPIGRKLKTHPQLVECVVTLLSVPSLGREDINVRNQIFLSRCSYNMLYHVADIRLNSYLIRLIVLVTLRLGHEELDRNVQHPFFKNFFSFFLSQIHSSSENLKERISYLGMFFNSSRLVRKFCVVGDGRRLVESIMNIVSSEYEKKKEILMTSSSGIAEDEEENMEKIELIELAITTLVDILESPACPRKDLREKDSITGIGYRIHKMFGNLSKNERLNPTVRDACQLVLEVLEENCENEEEEELDEYESDSDSKEFEKKSEEEEKYRKSWLSEFEKLDLEEKKRMEIKIEKKRKEIIKKDEKIHEEVREKEKVKLEEIDQIHNTERDRRRTAYWERLSRRADHDWIEEVLEGKAWLREVKGREDRVIRGKERLILERDRLRKLLVSLQLDLKQFAEVEKEEARSRIRLRQREEKLLEYANYNHSSEGNEELKNQVENRRLFGFEDIATPTTPLSPGDAFSRSRIQRYEREKKEPSNGGMFHDYSSDQKKKSGGVVWNKNLNKKKVKGAIDFTDRNRKKKKKKGDGCNVM